jgi:tetratricopeptide (TPR) repeat protein
MLKSEPNVLIEKEYADVNVCAGHYQKALNIYDSLLNQNYDYNTDLSRAEAYFYMRDSVNALQAFQSLERTHPDDYFVNLYLGDSYLRMGEYDKAKSVYERMQDSLKLDSTQNATVAMRYGWMPVTGVSGFFSYFPTYALLTPSASYYSDNIGIKNNTQGLRLDLGITTFLSVGVEDYRTTLASSFASVNSNTFRWDITLRLTNLLMFGINFGNTYYNLNNYSQPNVEIFARTEELNHYLIYGTYNRLDASQVIYSQYLVAVRLNADVYRIGGYYQFNSGIKASIDLTDLNFSDGNTGYTAFLRLGKYFYPDFFLGYAYANSGFRYTSSLYFSPISYSSHNIFADWDIIKDSTTTVTIGGLIGFPVNTTFILRQGYITGTFRVFDRLTIQGRIVGGSSLQNYVGYSSFYANLTAYWSL